MKKWREFENKLNKTCLKYRVEKKALIEYIKVGATDDGRPKTSTVDFTGIISPDGQGYAFDAKTTENKTSFSFSNIKTHQFVFLEYYHDMGAESYFFIRFNNINNAGEFYKVPAIEIINEWKSGKKSVKLNFFKDEWITKIEEFL